MIIENITLNEISSEEYKALTKNTISFNQGDFLELNSYKVEAVHYFLLKDKKNRLAYAVGEKLDDNGKIWTAPYSAPFSTPVQLREDIEEEYFWDLFELLSKEAALNNVKRINITLPPDIYGKVMNAKAINALLGNGFTVNYQELNYSLNVEKYIEEEYIKAIHHNARKNLRVATEANLEFKKCETEEDIKLAYEIIRINRESKNYYLAMTYEQVMETVKVLQGDFFLVKKGDEAITSAIVFHVSDEIVQVVYWGDIPGFGEYKPINFIANALLKYYKTTSVKKIDIGPSAPGGIPNWGLCRFKEGIGCDISSKFYFSKELSGE